jgi:hypothetical protein
MPVISAHTTATDVTSVVDDIAGQLVAVETDPSFILVFCGHEHDGSAIAAGLVGRMPKARVIGCSSAGEFTERTNSTAGVAAVAFPRSVAATVATALVDVGGGGVREGVAAAVDSLESQLGASLRGLDPHRYVGVVLIDGLCGHEEEINQALGRAAPFLSFVGGSAGDDLRFERTWVATDRATCAEGAVLAVLELTTPFTVLKTCSFVPSEQSFTVTRADLATRTVYELDERPVLEVYAAAAGVGVGELGTSVFMAHPFGLMIDGLPWIRSPQQITPDGGLKFYCRLPEDTKIYLMDPTDLVADTTSALAQAREQLAGHVGGGMLFNCILRRLELDATDRHAEFLRIFEGIPLAGLHTYGESWLGHINQTCTGLLVG